MPWAPGFVWQRALHVVGFDACPGSESASWHALNTYQTPRPQVLGQVGELPEVFSELEINFFLLRRLLGVRSKEGEKQSKASAPRGAAVGATERH